MKTLVRNFSHTFRRFMTASVLNIVGLSIAFASFFIIMTQVDYDLNFNKGYKDYEQIFRAEFDPKGNSAFVTTIPRPLGELAETSSPHITGVSIQGWPGNDDYEVEDNLFNEPTLSGFGNFMAVFQPEMVCGSADALNLQGQVLIPQSMALRFFGTTDAVGKTIFQGKRSNNKSLTIGGVYKDFPENTQIGNPLCLPLPADENKGIWNNWNYGCYVRLSSPDKVTEIEEALNREVDKIEYYTSVKDRGNSYFHLTPIADVHFSTLGDKSASSRATVYLLICVSFLIVVVATINFMNFSLAETPMRVRSINTQKVLGATTGSLRMSLVAESVLVSIIAWLLSVVLLVALRDSGVQDLVTADLDLANHPRLLAATFGISAAMGLAAGSYPSWYVTSFPPALALKGSFGLSPKGRRLRTALVCIQFFVAFTLVIAIGIMYAQSRYIRKADYGYDKDAIIIGNMTPETIAHSKAVTEDLKRISGVEGVSVSQFALNSYDHYMGWGMGEEERHVDFQVLPVDFRFLNLLDIRVTEGRNFEATDGNVLIANEAAHTAYPWLRLGEPPAEGGVPFPIIGFCENIRFTSFRNNDSAIPMLFLFYGKSYEDWREKNFVNVRISAGTDRIAVLRELQRTMEKFTPGHDFNFRFIDQIIETNYRNEMRFTRQILLFSLLAILISMIGVFGLTMFESEYRRKEIGIRKIFGSTTGEILRMFNRRYFYILLGCFAVAVPFGWWMGLHWLEGFAEKTPIRPWVFLTSFLLVTAITMITVTVQSWRNANENPANSIKTE